MANVNSVPNGFTKTKTKSYVGNIPNSLQMKVWFKNEPKPNTPPSGVLAHTANNDPQPPSSPPSSPRGSLTPDPPVNVNATPAKHAKTYIKKEFPPMMPRGGGTRKHSKRSTRNRSTRKRSNRSNRSKH